MIKARDDVFSGAAEQARLFREQAKKEELSPRLAKKLKQLEALKMEIQHLRQAADVGGRQILLKVQVLEVSPGMVRVLGFPSSRKGVAKTAPQKPRQGDDLRPGFVVEVLDEKNKLSEIITVLSPAIRER